MQSNCKSGIDVFLKDTVFKDKQLGTYLEAGANDGITDSISYFYELIGWTGVLVEPIQEMFIKCNKIRSNRNKFFNCCIGDSESVSKLTVPIDNYDNSSLVMSDKHRQTLHAEGFGKSYCELYTYIKPYSDIIKESNINELDLCIIDVEGFENRVLNGIMSSGIYPEVIVAEYDWSDKNELIDIVFDKYNVLKEFSHDIVFLKK